MPVKIGFTIISSTGEDERYRTTELNYHGPTVRGWRSAMNCTYPQEIVMQLNMTSVLHRIQILSHQYLIPQKIEIWISEGFECDPSSSPSGVETFEYLGFITLSDNQSTGFKSRELKSITVPPTTARYIKLRLHSNHVNEKNIYNQIGLIAVNVLGDEAQEFDPDGGEVNNNGTYYSNQLYESTLISNPQYVSPYDDLAFAMYVDKDIARIMRVMEVKKQKAVLEERFEYASKLKMALEDLREVGETLGKFEQEKRQAINTEDYDKAKLKKLQIDQYREQVYRVLHIDKLLELDGPEEENDLNSNTAVNRSIRKQELAPPHLESLEAEKSVRNQRGTSPSQDDMSTEREEKAEWDYQSQYKNVSQFNRSPALNQLIHSQSQSSFDRYGSYEENLTTYTSQNFHSTQKMEYPTTLHHSQVFSTTSFQMKTNPYNCHTWQLSTEEPSEMYHSMPNQQTLDRRKQILTEKSDAEELPQLQRNYSDGEIKTTLKYSQKTVEFGQPAVQAPSTTVDIESDTKSQSEEGEKVTRPKSPAEKNTLSKSPSSNAVHRPNTLRESVKRRNKSSCSLNMKNSYEAYEERMLPALRHYHANEIVRECQLGLVEPTRKSKLNEREKKQAALPITVFGIELVEKFYSKHFDDKEEGLKQLQEYLKRHINAVEESPGNFPQHSPNKTARAAIFLLHRALRDKVYSVYSSAADTIRLFFSEYVPKRVSSAEVARSVEKLLPELIAKSGDSTPRIHNMAAHTLLSMADCKEVRELHIIPVHLSRPLTSSVHPRLALSRLEMIEQLILNHGISTDKQSGLTCRTLAEFGSSGLHHPAEAVRKVSERILIQVYRVNPRLVRKQLPPDDDITRRNLLYRQLFQEFDFMDMQRKRELNEKIGRIPPINRAAETQNKIVQSNWESSNCQDVTSSGVQSNKAKKEKIFTEQIPKRTVNQQTSPMKPFSPAGFGISGKNESPGGILRSSNAKKEIIAKTAEKNKILPTKDKDNFCNGEQKMTCQLDKRKGMTRITEERSDTQTKNDSSDVVLHDEKNDDEDVSLKFPNLVDSVRVAENKLPFARKGMRNMKSLKYIFPTSYIGNSTTSQTAVNASNTENSFCKIVKKPEWGPIKTQSLSNSGIPLPTNRRYTGLFSPMDSSKKFNQSDAEKKAETSFKKIEEDDLHEELNKKDEVAEMSSSMMESLYIDNEANVEEEGNTEAEEVIKVKNEGRDCNSKSRETNSDTNNAFRMCIFCFAWENWFTEESLNQHYCKSCPMLTRCSYCKEVVEISGLIQHRLDDCEHRHLFVKCDVCQEAVTKELIKNHECIASESKNPKTRCCQCHSDIGSEDDWREHLMGVNVCPNHPRRNGKEEDTEKRRALADEETLFLTDPCKPNKTRLRALLNKNFHRPKMVTAKTDVTAHPQTMTSLESILTADPCRSLEIKNSRMDPLFMSYSQVNGVPQESKLATYMNRQNSATPIINSTLSDALAAISLDPTSPLNKESVLLQVQAHRRDLGTPNSIRPLVGRSNGESPNLGAPTPPPIRDSPISNSLLNDHLGNPSPAYRYQVSQENVGGTTYFYPATTPSGDSPPNTVSGFQGFAASQSHISQEESIPPSMSFYVSESIRSDILEKNSLTMLQPDTQMYPDLPATVDNYHELVPLEPLPIGDAIQIGHSSTYKATHIKTGVRYCLRRIHGFRLSNTKCMVLVDMWKRLSHTNIVHLKEVFTTKAFGDNSIIFVYEYHPGSETLWARHFSPSETAGPAPFSADPTAPRPYSHTKNALLRHQHSSMLPENVLWNYIIQITAAVRVIHGAGLACRNLDPSKVIISSRNRLRLSCVGVTDVLTSDSSVANPLALIPHYQQEDLTALGKLVLALACKSLLGVQRENIQTSLDLVGRTYSTDLKNLIVYLLCNRQRTVTDLMPMIGARFYAQLDNVQTYADEIETELAKEMDNGRLCRLLAKLGTINERPEFNLDPSWSETGDRYMLKLFRDYVFHQVTEDGRPWLDMSHIVNCLNKLDAGSQEKICLMSRDEQSILVVTYEELKHCLEQSFNDVVAAATEKSGAL